MMVHSEDTIRQLSKVQYNIFGRGVKLALFVMCVVWIYFALFANLDGPLQLICLMGGCLTAVNLNLPAKRNADKILEQLAGRQLKTKYEFRDDVFVLVSLNEDDAEPTQVPYTDIIRLVEDRTHYYLFISRFGAYMIDKRSIRPADDQFRQFMQSACSRKWTPSTGFLSAFSGRSKSR